MSVRIAIAGTGAVSPAGWSGEELAAAVFEGRNLPVEERESEGTWARVPVRVVPPPAGKTLRHPRLRRVSPVVRFAVAAGMEALGEERLEALRAGELRLGVIVNVVNGCVGYSRRFFREVLEDVSTASPILFPETVFNSIASHVAAVIDTRERNYTLLGDATQFLTGVDLAAGWLVERKIDGCLVIGAEELDWLSFEAARVFSREMVVSEGAGAIYLERSEEAPEIELAQVTHAVTYGSDCSPKEAAAKMRGLLPGGLSEAIVVSDEAAGEGVGLRAILGFGIGAATAWQAVVAAEALRTGRCRDSFVHGFGTDQQAIGAHFRRN